MRTVSLLAVTALLLPALTSAHMFMMVPWPRGFEEQKLVPEADYDYTIHGPSYEVCKGHKKGVVAQTITAGETVKVTLSGARVVKDPSGWANHNGGHCQWAISYDDGKTFATIHRHDHTCVVKNKAPYATVQQFYNIPIPKNVVNSEAAIFAWTWVAANGLNNEMFMSCADVKIEGGAASGSYTGPSLVYRNMPGYKNHTHWDGGIDPHFTDMYGTVDTCTINA